MPAGPMLPTLAIELALFTLVLIALGTFVRWGGPRADLASATGGTIADQGERAAAVR